MLKFFQATVAAILLLHAAPALAAGWLIFDIAGDAQLTRGREVTPLSASKHLLTEIAAGDSIATKGNGKVTLVSTATNDAFEIGANAVVAVGEKELKASKGTFTQQKGYALPKKKPMAMAGLVMRGDPHRECLKITRGTATATHTLTPTLQWQNTCDGNPVRLSLFSGEGLVLEQEVNGGELTVPQGLLGYGQRYVWLLETRRRDQLAAAAFRTLPEETAATVAGLLGKPCCRRDDLAGHLSDLFFLRDQGLTELADEKQAVLAREYPEIDINTALGR
ncbi:MAG: hypothetical protein FDZ69_12665 [Deltaproteobacteria bacterium]|nr:MAG: hypothetical protein FDZ69_12665 [Deltaproteobacteria bacterium]